MLRPAAKFSQGNTVRSKVLTVSPWGQFVPSTFMAISYSPSRPGSSTAISCRPSANLSTANSTVLITLLPMALRTTALTRAGWAFFGKPLMSAAMRSLFLEG